MNLNTKSRLVSLALTILFGPLGLLYSSTKAALFLIVVALISIPTVFGPVICWGLAIVLGDHCTYKHNKNIRNFKEIMAHK